MSTDTETTSAAPIEPQPKQLAKLSHSLGARPRPLRRNASTDAATGPSGSPPSSGGPAADRGQAVDPAPRGTESEQPDGSPTAAVEPAAAAVTEPTPTQPVPTVSGQTLPDPRSDSISVDRVAAEAGPVPATSSVQPVPGRRAGDDPIGDATRELSGGPDPTVLPDGPDRAPSDRSRADRATSAAARSRTSPTRRRESPATRPRPRSSDGEPTVPVVRRRRDQAVFYLPIAVSDQLRDLARRENRTNADVIFDAIEFAMPNLAALLQVPDSGTDGGGVFQRAEPKPVGRKVQVSAVVSDPNLEVIDRLAAEHGAPSRSELVEVALAAYFTHLGVVPA